MTPEHEAELSELKNKIAEAQESVERLRAESNQAWKNELDAEHARSESLEGKRYVSAKGKRYDSERRLKDAESTLSWLTSEAAAYPERARALELRANEDWSRLYE